MRPAPDIDGRSAEQIFRAVEQRLPFGATDAFATALVRVFSRYCELIVQRLDRVPDKNYLVFLDTLNVSRMPPVPARVPLTFTPSKRPSGVRVPTIVPAQTQAAAAQEEGDSEPVVFETSREIALTDATLAKIVALDPSSDSFGDKSLLATAENAAGEFPFDTGNPIPHEFYIRSEEIFSTPGISRLILRFEIARAPAAAPRQAHVQWLMLAGDHDVVIKPLQDTTAGLMESGQVEFADLPEWPVSNVSDQAGRWLECRLIDRLPRSKTDEQNDATGAFPPIQSVAVSAQWHSTGAAIDSAFLNASPLDLSRDFFPFAERPRFNDVFYVGSAVFARARTEVVLDIALTNPASGPKTSPLPRANQAGHPVLQWECWDGKRWEALRTRDTTEALTVDGKVAFRMPASAQATTVNGTAAGWIRARLIGGNYGEDERVEFSPAGGYHRIPATLAPPSIQSISITAFASAGPAAPDAIVTHNNFILHNVSAAHSFIPFIAARSSERTLNLGLDLPDEDFNAANQATLDLYFHMGESPEPRVYLRSPADRSPPVLKWQYWNGIDWADAAVAADSTEGLTASGVVSLILADDFARRQRASMGGPDLAARKRPQLERKLFWLRIGWAGGEFPVTPQLRRVLVNTVEATHTLTLRNEILGSSTRRPSQRFFTVRRPILRDLSLDIREPDLPEAAEREWIETEEGPDAVRTITDAQGRVAEVWVRWHEVANFLSSTHRDRHFVVNREAGEILFGDGLRGAIPPAGANNVVLERYQTGGGNAGNKRSAKIVEMRTTVPYVDSVNNLEAAYGGQELEDSDSLRERGSRWLRHRERAVTVEDYEDLARLASPVVAKARCYSTSDLASDRRRNKHRRGSISVVIVPRSAAPAPIPDFILLRRVRGFLDQRRPADVDLVLLGPEYARVRVAAVIAPEGASSAASLVMRCREALDRYLHPVFGGDDERGWNFGERPEPSDIYRVLESIDGVAYVRSLELHLHAENLDWPDSGRFLICSGEHRIELAS